MSNERPLILISNDDGITAPGIKALVETMKPLGDLVVIAPDSPQSGMGHAITITRPLRLHKSDVFGKDVLAFQCSGTPADCVKLALDKVVDRKPQLLVSGINHGSNASINVLYSGTMSAAVEGAIDGLNAIGFSLCDYSFEADFEASKTYVRKIAKNVLLHGLPKDTLLNVNVPNVQKKDIKGIKICRQARAKWVEEFDERRDPNGRKYFWLTGQFSLLDHDEKTDEWSLKNDYVSVVPVQFDLTAYNALKTLESWDWT